MQRRNEQVLAGMDPAKRRLKRREGEQQVANKLHLSCVNTAGRPGIRPDETAKLTRGDSEFQLSETKDTSTTPKCVFVYKTAEPTKPWSLHKP